MHYPLRYLSIILVSFILVGCQTTTTTTNRTLYPVGVDGQLLAQNEFLMVNDNMAKPSCYKHGRNQCPNAPAEPVQLQFRLNGENFAYRLAWSTTNNVKPDPAQPYGVNIDFMWEGKAASPFKIYGITFENAQLIESPITGRKYWVTDWTWNAVLYQKLANGNVNYPSKGFAMDVKLHREFIKYIGRHITAEGPTSLWDVHIFKFNRSITWQNWHRRNLYGDNALAAVADPEQIFASHIQKMDDEQRAKTLARINAKPANNAYSKFVANTYAPFTVNGFLKRMKCKKAPGRGYQKWTPLNEIYEGGDEAIETAECYDKALAAYDPNQLIAKYEQTLDKEAELFAKTLNAKRFSLQTALAQTKKAEKEIRYALKTADWYYDAGDDEAQRRNQARKRQQQKTAAMQNLMRSLQQTNAALQRTHDQAAANVRALQRQAFQNHNQKRREYNAAARTAQNSAQALPRPKPVKRNTGTSTQQAAAKPAGLTRTIYLAREAASGVVDHGVPIDARTCLEYDLVDISDSTRMDEIICKELHDIRLHRLTHDPKRCKGENPFNWVGVELNKRIGSVYKIEKLTEQEARLLVQSKSRESGHGAPRYYKRGTTYVYAHSAFEEWYYALDKGQKLQGTWYKDKTLIEGIALQNGCTHIKWVDKLTGKTEHEKLLID